MGDAESYFSSGLTQYFYIGELNGERISCISVVKYGERFAFVGYYIVIESQRGKGYGMKTWKHALAFVGDQCNVALDGVLSMEEDYVRSGFHRDSLTHRYDIVTRTGLQALAKVEPPAGVKIINASLVDFQKLLAYDTEVFGFDRAHLLASLIALCQECSWAAIQSDQVVGYLILRKTVHVAKDGYRVAPLLADSTPIARSLFKMAFEFVACDSSQHIVAIDIPVQLNPESIDLAKNELTGNLALETVRMHTKGLVVVPWKKVYGFFNVEIG